ncbi:hypothetical protein C6501_09440 [Candidatus Poribacteria bacterium]|nr:MAG: hypothetical protein C6501_09440 [Candidatus Poribacteria bacterium]
MTVRALLLGLALVVVQAAITPYNDYYLQGTDIAGNHFPLGAVFTLIFLTLVINPILKSVFPRATLNPAELIVIWVMMGISSAIPSKGMMGFLLPYLAAPVYFATPENEWAETLHPHFPEWLIVWDKHAVTNFYEGESVVPWALWLKPIFVWTVFILLLYCVTICVSIVLRKQWVERERFIFPLVTVPVEMVQQTSTRSGVGGLFRNRFVWIGFGIAAAFHLLNGLHEYFPALPSIPNRYDLSTPFTERPWIVMRWWPQFRFFLYFSVIGITYFLAMEVSFSCWFFFLFFKLQYIIINAFAIPISPWICARGQTMAAYVVMVLAFLINSRAHIKDILKRTFSQSTVTAAIDDSDEVLPYRWAVLGVIFSFLLLAGLCAYTGMSFWVACSIITLFLITSTALSWMVVNGGMLLIQAPMYPIEYFEIITGSRIINANSLALLGFQRVMMRDWGGILMPSVLHGFKAADPLRLNRRNVLWAMALAIVVAIGVSYAASLPLIYEKGGLNLQRGPFIGAPRYFNHIVSLIQYPRDAKLGETYSMILGVGITSFLLIMQRQFMWWQLHPIGYVMGAVYSSYFLWSCIFIGWFLKFLVLKSGGIGYYRRFRPLFMGLIVGEFGIVGLWMILGMFTGVNYQNALPG